MSIAMPTAPTVKDQVHAVIEERSGEFVRLAHDIQARPERALDETYAAARITALLAEDGFNVRLAVFGLPTAFDASIGNGPLHVALGAEYDGLEDSIGPGCGHNLVAGAAVAAAIGLRGVVDEVGLTVSVIGTAGEELIGLRDPPAGQLVERRSILLEAAAFDDVHAALMVHLGPTRCTEFFSSRNDPMLSAAYRRNAEALGPARELDKDLLEELRGLLTLFPCGTDLGNVSQIIPAIRPIIGIGGTAPCNIAEFIAQSDTDEAYRAMLDGGVALGWTALDAATDPTLNAYLLDRARLARVERAQRPVRWSS